jgi:[ribosomal protein S5]-alanine N-acetyltransferase
MQRPTLTTPRLVLRPFSLEDAPRVQLLAGVREVAENTMAIPHPYPDGAAEAWIGSHQEAFEKGESLTFAVCLRDGGDLTGAVGLMLSLPDRSAELGYWIGVPYWNRGYATEAVWALVRFGFESMNLHRIHAGVFTGNPASIRVLLKIGFRYEGLLRQHNLKWGEFRDVQKFGILEEEWQSFNPSGNGCLSLP